MRVVLWAALLLTLSACGASNPGTLATLQAQNVAFVQEATGIAQTLDAREAQIRGTAVAADTQVVERNSVNQQLLATVRAGDPPTQQMIVVNPQGQRFPTPIPSGGDTASLPHTAALPPAPSGQFVDTVTTGSIRDSDGCANGAQSQFSASDDRIYVVTRATQLTAGTVVGVEWRFEGQVVDSGSWTASSDQTDFCIWFYLDDFSAGNWAVQLTANGAAISPAPSFTVTA